MPLAAKTVVCHTITYFLMVLLVYHFLHYAATINNPNSGMRPTTSTWVLLGPALQIFRDILFASVFSCSASSCSGAENGGCEWRGCNRIGIRGCSQPRQDRSRDSSI